MLDPKRMLGAIALAVLVPLVVACGDDDTNADDVRGAVGEATGAQQAFCDSLGELKSAVGEADSLSANSSVEEAEDVKSDIESALEDVKDAAGGIASAGVAALETAYEAMSNAIEDVSGDDTLGQAASSIASETTAINNALSEAESTACS